MAPTIRSGRSADAKPVVALWRAPSISDGISRFVKTFDRGGEAGGR